MTTVIELREVSLTLAGYTILDDLSICFPYGESTFIIGKSGSGKSTLLKTAAGLMVPDSGQVLYDGLSLSRMNRSEELSFRRNSTFAFQDAALWANQSIYNNIALPLAVHESHLSREEISERVQAVAAEVNYNESLSYRPDTLSAGEQKLISFARCLVLNPKLYFMDEPTASLDEEAVETLVKIMLRLKREGKTLIVVSHDPRLIAEVADHLCIVAGGQVVGSGPPDEVAPLVGGELMKRIRQARERAGLEHPGEGELPT